MLGHALTSCPIAIEWHEQKIFFSLVTSDTLLVRVLTFPTIASRDIFHVRNISVTIWIVQWYLNHILSTGTCSWLIFHFFFYEFTFASVYKCHFNWNVISVLHRWWYKLVYLLIVRVAATCIMPLHLYSDTVYFHEPLSSLLSFSFLFCLLTSG